MKTNKFRATLLATLIILLAGSIVPALAQTITVDTDKDYYIAGDTLTVSGTISPYQPGVAVAIQVIDPNGNIKAVAQATPDETGAYSATILTFSEEDPSGTWTVKATYSGVSAEKTIFLGIAPVTVTTDKPTYAPGESLIVSGKVATVKAGQAIAIQVFDPRGNRKAVSQATPAADGTYSVSVMTFALTDPAGTWKVTATYLGQTVETTFELVSDVEPPTLTSVTTDKGSYIGGSSITVTVITSDNVGITSVTATIAETGASTTLASTAVPNTYVGTLTAPTSEGTYTIEVVVTDSGGNTASGAASFKVDNTTPAIVVTAPKEGAKVYTSTITVSGTVTDNVAVKSLTVNGVAVSIGPAGMFSKKIALVEGPNIITITATDEAGNTITKSILVTYVKAVIKLSITTAGTYVTGESAAILVITTAEGLPIDANIVSLEIYRPDGLTDTPTPEKVATGSWTIAYKIPDITGTYFVVVSVAFQEVKELGTAAFKVTTPVAEAKSVAVLSSKVADLSSDVAGLKGDIAGLKTAISALDTAVSGLGTKVAGVSSDVAGLKGDIANLAKAVSAAKSAVEALDGRLSAIDSKVAGLDGKIGEVGAKFGDVISAIADVKNSIGAAQSDLAGKISDVKTSIGAIDSSVKAVRSDVDSAKAAVENIGAGLGQISSFVLVAAALSAITVILAIVILIRRR
jgi:hypothetical protein